MTIRRHVTLWISKATRAKAQASALAATHARTHLLTQKYVTLIAFHGNSGFVNKPQCYFIRILPVFFTREKNLFITFQ